MLRAPPSRASSLREIGDKLRRAGLTQPALLAWSGTHRISTWPWKLSGFTKLPVTPAASTLALFVGGLDQPTARLSALPLDALVEHGLVDIANDTVHAKVAILPLEQTLVVCDRLDADDDESSASSRRNLVCWPDDSSYHLASAIPPGRRDRWIDLATGSAFAPLARPALASSILGIDLNERAIRFARLGTQLSGCSHVELSRADIGEIIAEPAQLVTCNAPILADPDPAIWRSTDQAFFDRMWRTARACVAPGGEVIVHCVVEGIPDDLEGDLTTVVYTPPEEPGYAVTWWSPDAPARRSLRYRELTAARPHLEPRDRDDVRAGALPDPG